MELSTFLIIFLVGYTLGWSSNITNKHKIQKMKDRDKVIGPGSGIALITEERLEQIDKHRIRLFQDKQWLDFQLTDAVGTLILSTCDKFSDEELTNYLPDGWDKEKFFKMCRKPYLERLKIAGGLLAAEIDRVNLD